MSARPDTWMPLYWGDYLRDTMHLRVEGHGAYLMLLGACWMAGGELPDDDAQLSAVARCDHKQWRTLRPVLAKLFQVGDGKWTHKRVAKELTRSKHLAEVKRTSGGAGGKAKAVRVAAAKRTPTPSQSPSPLPLTATIGESNPSASDSSPERAREDSLGVAVSGSGVSQSDSPKWRMQATRDDYAQTEIVKHLVTPRGVEPWTVMAKAEDPNDADHDACVTLVLAAAKAAGVGWISPAERRRRGRPGAPEIPDYLDRRIRSQG